MGKASSSKKVARAAGIGGSRSLRRQRPWGFYGVIGLIVVLGLAGTFVSRHQRDNAIAAAGANGGVTVGSTNFEIYAVDLCGTFTYVKAPAANPHGITAYDYTGTPKLTDGGVIQIEPTNADYAGANATLGKFTDAVGVKLNAAAIQMPGGKQYLANSTTCDGTPGVVYVKQFSSAQDTVGKLYNGAKGQLAKLNPIDVPIGPPCASGSSTCTNTASPYITIAFVPPSWATKTCAATSASSSTTSTTTATSSTTKGSAATTSTTVASTTTTTTPAASNPASVTGCIPPPNPDLGTELTAAETAAAAASTSSTTIAPTTGTTTATTTGTTTATTTGTTTATTQPG